LKRKKLLKALEKLGAKLIRHGSKHDVYGNDQKSIGVPRHADIEEQLAKDIIKYFSN
jgi:predicted RNA binding protein YcfA (HicA-like mRNA interferase family)